MRLAAIFLLLAPLAFAQSGGADARFAHAVELHHAGDFEGALREYESVLAVDPNRVDARSNLGAVLSKLGRYQEAIDQYRQALTSAPLQTKPYLRLNLALAYYKSNRIEEAKVELSRLHAEQPYNINTTLLLADCNLRSGDYKQVISLLTPLEPAQPDNRAVTYMLGMALIRDGQVEQGQQRVDQILRAGDTVESRFLLAMGMFMAKDYPSAVQAFRHAIELDPTVPSLQSFYGQALLATGDADGAMEAFHKELSANSNDYDANLGLGEILAHRRQTADATNYLQRAIQLRPEAAEARAALANAASAKTGALEGAGGVAVGTLAPDFDPLNLRKLRGHKPVVIVFGSYTCPQFRGDAPALNALYEEYKDRVSFLLVYIKEAHSSEQWQSTINERQRVEIEPARDMAEKQNHAALCVRKLNIKFPAVTDGMDGKIEAAYEAWPSRVYLVDATGRVSFNSRLGELNFQAEDLAAAIRKSLAAAR